MCASRTVVLAREKLPMFAIGNPIVSTMGQAKV
jgi:hypothetical protein